LKSQLLEILKIWCKDNKIVWSSVFANMSKIALVSEIKKIRRSLTKVWAHEYSVSLKKNLEGFVCINKNTQDSEIESLDIEKLIRIIQWWNARWGEVYEDKQVLNQSQKKLEDEVKKIRDEISAGGIHKKLSDYTKIFGNKKEIKKKRIENLSGDKFARKMTPKEKEASDWKESANEDIQEKAEKWCVSYTKEGRNKLRELVNAKRSFDITKGVVMKDANRDVTTDWGRQKLFAIAYWKQSRVDGEFMSVSEICDKDDDGIAELVDKIHLRCSKKRHVLDQHSKKRKKESVTDMGNIDDKKKRDEEAMLEEYTRKENERKSIEWYEGLEGRPVQIKVEKFMSTTPIQEKNKAILEIASIVWNAYECQSDIVQGGLVDELDHDLLKSYCYFFQKDENFKDWEVIKTFDNETVAKTIKYMIEKTKLKFCEGEIKTFQVQRELMQEEKDLLNWKYSSGPMVVAKVKKYELEMEEMFGSNIEIELQSIRTAFNWTRGVLSKFKMKNCERNKIKSVDSKTLSISVYWNQKQDINHIKLKAINEMREDQLYKFALRVNDLVRRNVNYTSGDVTSAPKDKDVVMKDVVNTEFEQTKTEAMEFASMDWEKSEVKKNEPVPIVTPAKTLSIKKKWNENRIGSSTKLASQTSIKNYTNCTSDINESGVKGIKITPKETSYIKEGININMMSTKQKVINKGLRKNDLNHPLPLNTEEEIKIPVESTPVLKMRDVTARFEIAVDDQLKVNIPLVARQTFRLFKQADRTCRLMPFYGNGNEDLEAIDEEDGIPNEESKIKMWVDNPRFISTKLHFSMRISTMVPLKHIKDTLFPWMAKNKSYVKLDNLRCREIHCIGCIVDIHTTFYNRYKLKDFLGKQLAENGYKKDFNLYSRNVWNIHKGEKVVTRAIVMEVDKVNKDFAIDAMIAVNIRKEYRHAKFIPFNKSQFPPELMNMIMKSNNEYHAKCRKRKIDGLDEIELERSDSRNRVTTIQSWMQNIECTSGVSKFLFEKVETNVYGETVIIFDMGNNEEVNAFLSVIKDKLISEFPEKKDDIEMKVQVPLMSTESTKRSTYAQMLMKHYSKGDDSMNANQFPIAPPSSSRLYYGSSKGTIKESYVNHMSKEKIEEKNKSNVEKVRDTNKEVVKKLDEMTAKQLAMEESINEKILSIMNDKKLSSKEIEESESKMENMMNIKLSKLESSIDGKLNMMQEKHTDEINKVFNTFENQLHNALETQESLMQSLQDQMRLTMSKQSIVQQRQHNEMLSEVKSSIVNTLSSLTQSPPEVAASLVKFENEEDGGEMPQ